MKNNLITKCTILAAALILNLSSRAQFNMWTWMAGDNLPNQGAVFGTQGVAAPTNKPQAHYEGAGEWTDAQGNFWHFGAGGFGNYGNTLWKFDPNTQQWTWMKGPTAPNQPGVYGTLGVPNAANYPGGRAFASITWADNVGNLWLFGGYGHNSTAGIGWLDDFWRYNIASNQWTWMGGSSTLFGQNGSYGTQGVFAASNYPPSRCETDFGFCDAAGNFWIGFGMSASGSQHNDIWQYNPTSGQWAWMKGSNVPGAAAVYGTQGVAAMPNTPGNRMQYASWKDPAGKMWLFGSRGSTGQYDDLWKYDPTTNMWTWMKGAAGTGNTAGNYGTKCVAAASNNPPALYENRARWTDDCGNLWLFGGNSHNDLWRYSQATNMWTWVSGASTTGQAGVYGTKGVAAAGNVPGARAGSFAFRRPNTNELWFMGGGLPGDFNDFWRYTPDKPTAIFTFSPNNACAPATVNFTNSSTPGCNEIKSHLWNFGDPGSGAANTSTLTNPSHVFNNVGTYTVKLVVTNCTASKDSITNIVTVSGCVPTVTITGKSICQGTCAVLTATAASGTPPYTYSWTPNIGSTAGPFTVCPNVTTTYTLKVTDANNMTATDTAVVIVNPSITLTPTVTNIPCFGQTNGTATASLTGGTGPFSYTWTNGQFTPTATSLTPGPYTVVVVDSKGCTATGTANITQPPLLTGTLSSGNIKCFGVNIGSISVSSGGGTGVHVYNWSNGPTTPTITNLGAGTYSVIISDANSCTLSLSANITQPPALSLTINSSTSNICAGGIINVNSSVNGGTGPYTYTWNPGPNTAAFNASEIIAGNYNYVLNVLDNNGCPITGNISLTFNPIPVITASSQTICMGDKGVLTANGAETYKWMPINYTGSSYTTTGTNNLYLTVIGTNTSTGCWSLPVTSTLVVNPLPVPAISASNNKGCVPICMTFTASNTAGSIQSCSWDFGDGSFASNVINTDRCFNLAGEYTVTATVTDNNGCVAKTTTTLEVYPYPIADFNYAPLKPIVNNSEVTFTDASHEAKIVKWDWYFMNLPKPHSNLQNPMYIYDEAGTYAIALVVTSDHGCLDTIVKTIVVGEDYGIYVPNIFTPNGDGVNDVFQPKGFGITKYEFRIFNRWGEELMFTNDFYHGWDGMYKGKLSQEDTYIWKINLTNVFGKSHELSGHVTLIK